MTQLIVALTVAVILILVLLAYAAGRATLGQPQPESTRNTTQSELLSLAHNLELPSYKVVAGISDARDLDYILAKAPALRKTLLHDRTRLARLWLTENRRHLKQLLRLHRLIERTSESLSVAVEFRVIATYFSLQFMLLAAEALVFLAGPFRARSLGLSTMAAFDQLSGTIAATATTLDAGKKASIRTSWARVS